MSTLKVAALQGLSASSDAITLANDGTCTANITNNLSNRNLIINGAMQVAQRGTSSTSSGYYTVDRFTTDFGGTDEAPTFAQADVASGTTPYTSGFRKSLKVTNGNQTSGAGTADFIGIGHRIEAQNLATSGWNYVSASSYITLSFWVKSSVAQSFKGYVKTSDGSAYIYSFDTGSLSADTWTKVTKTISGNSNLTINNDNGLGLEFYIWQFAGTDYTASSVTEDAWASYASGTRMKDETSTWYTTNDATFEITGVQLEVGDHATDFEHRSFGDELARCQRYFQKSYSYGDAVGSATSTGTAWVTIAQGGGRITHTAYLKVRMRATPTFKTYDWAGTVDKVRTQLGNGQSASAIYASENTVIVDVNNVNVEENIFQYTAEAEL